MSKLNCHRVYKTSCTEIVFIWLCCNTIIMKRKYSNKTSWKGPRLYTISVTVHWEHYKLVIMAKINLNNLLFMILYGTKLATWTLLVV